MASHTASADIFSFSARATLHHAHLAHAEGDLDRAIQCYEVAEAFAEERGDEFVRVSARAGRVCMRIGRWRDREFEREKEEAGSIADAPRVL